MKIKKFVLILGAALLLLAGCKPAVTPVNPSEGGTESPSAGGNDSESKDDNSGSQGGNNGNNSGNPGGETDGKYVPLTEANNPTIGDGKRKKSLQYIFNTDSVGESEIYIKRSEWNKMLAYYDYFYKNENTVAVEQFTYKKDGMQWDLKDCGMRLRGNTSRFRPQGKDFPTDETNHTMPNANWSSDYYSYAANCPDDDYRQSHFKIDFEPYDAKQKLAGCMKGVALKRMDAAYAREILCYDLFHEYDVFSATRASHTKVTIYMIEEDETLTPVDFGVYEMFEEVNDQFLKARDEADPSAQHTFTHWANADGDLWKCGGNLTPSDVMNRAGVEDVCIKSNGVEIEPGETKEKSTWAVVDHRYGYDLKTNKKKFDAAKDRLLTFANELEALRVLSLDDAGIAQRKAFYEKWFDIDLFLTTYAVNVVVGMDDDYWGNANNFYLYFDNAVGGTGKCFLLPFDYDNTLGQSINGDGVYNNPLDWGWNHEKGERYDRPLMDRLLEVPEYRELYRQKLLEVTAEDSAWSMNKSGAKVTKWKNMVSAKDTDGKPLTYSKDLDHDQALTALYWADYGGWKNIKHYLNSEPNIYDQVRTNFKNWVALDRGIDIEIDFNGGIVFNPETGIEQTEPVSLKLDLETFPLHSLEGVTLADALPMPKKEGAVFEGWTKTKGGNDLVKTEIPEKIYAKWSNEVLLYSSKENGNVFDLRKINGYWDQTIEIRISFDKSIASSTGGDGDWAGFGFGWEDRIKDWWVSKGSRDSFTEILKFRYNDLYCLYQNCADSDIKWELRFNCFGSDSAYTAEVYVTGELPDIKVTFDSNGGSVCSDSFVFVDSALDYQKLLDYKNPVKPGYLFACWCFDAALTQPVSLDSFPDASEVTLYALWIEEEYKKIYKMVQEWDNDSNQYTKHVIIPAEDFLTQLPEDGEIYNVTIVGKQLDLNTNVNIEWGSFVSGAEIDKWWTSISGLYDVKIDNSNVKENGKFIITMRLETMKTYKTTKLSDIYIRLNFNDSTFNSLSFPATVLIEKKE